MIYRVLSAEPLLTAGATAGPVLGFDSGSMIARIGLVSGGRIVASVAHRVKSHGADLPAAIDELMHDAGIKIKELSAIAVGTGPGSFTGLRVGVSYAKGLAAGASIRIVGIPSLDAMALCGSRSPTAHNGVKICPILDARKGEVYTSLYEVVNDALEKISDDLVIPLDEFASRITGEVLFVGDSKAEDARVLVVRNGGSATIAGAAELWHQGSFIAALGAARVARDDVDEAATVEPLYVRAPGASVKSTAVNPGEGTHGTARRRVGSAACGS
jgi:tRNA threonylcarbamoyladenosine biosynthesis protein TsaB